MSLKADLSSLPKAEPERVEGLRPDDSPRFVGALVEKWATEYDENKPTAMETRFRHSDSGKCARAIAYTAAGIPRSDPMDLAGVWNVRLGSEIHTMWQEALGERYPDAEIEAKARIDDFDGSCHVDAVVRTEDKTVAIELKSIGGYGFRASIGKARRGAPAEGPRSDHLLQAALNGLAVGADEVVVAYLAKECISAGQAGDLDALGRFSAEWTLTREQYEPLARDEIKRVSGILALVDNGQLAARKIPDLPPGAEIVDPGTGRYEQRDHDGTLLDTGSFWACGYCAFRTVCATTKPGRIPIKSVVPVEVAS